MRNFFYLLLIGAVFTTACKNNESKPESEDTSRIVLEKKRFNWSDRITLDDAKEFREAFLNSFPDNRFPKSILISRAALTDLVSDQTIEGVRVFPIMYSREQTRGTVVFNENTVGYLLVPEKKNAAGEADLDIHNMWDYNSPCPPQNCKDITEYK